MAGITTTQRAGARSVHWSAAPSSGTCLSLGYYPILLRRICTEIWRFGTEQVIVIVLAIAALALQIRYGAERETALHLLTTKPPRTSAEQHDYDTAKAALALLKQKGVIALRHLRKHGTLTFGFNPPVLPPGLTLNDTFWVYNHCASEGVVTCSEKSGSGEKTYTISAKMVKALDELLYDDATSAAE